MRVVPSRGVDTSGDYCTEESPRSSAGTAIESCATKFSIRTLWGALCTPADPTWLRLLPGVRIYE